MSTASGGTGVSDAPGTATRRLRWPRAGANPGAGNRVGAGADGSCRWRFRIALVIVLAAALGLRLWGVRQGLPYVYNADENAHFLPRAIGMFGHSLNPNYFANPPAFTYWLHFLFGVWFGGRAGVSHQYALHPTAVFDVARGSVAVLGTVSVGLLYVAGRRLFDRRVGLLAAALMAVAFLPVFYSHLALNDVPTLAPLTLALVGIAGVLRRGRMLDYLLAGVGLGLACATKYTGGVVLVALLAATIADAFTLRSPAVERPARATRTSVSRRWPRALLGIALAGLVALVAFVLANPYAALDFNDFWSGLAHQSSATAEAQGKLGASRQSGFVYYLWTFTWGLGWAPSIAALGGALVVWRRQQRLGWVLVPAALLFLLFMGHQGRFFGRWLLPIFPIACLLAAYFAVALADAAGRRAPRARPLILTLLAIVLCAQGAIYSIHSGRVLSRAHTSNLARAWMVTHIPVGAHIVVEPIVPATWVQDVGHPDPTTRNGDRWVKYPSLLDIVKPDGTLDPAAGRPVNIEDYERTLSPALIPYYEQHLVCWVVSGSTQSGRASADPRAVPGAVAYYRALAQHAQIVFRASPYTRDSDPVDFNFDWTFDYYPLAYHRPGPEMTIYRLHGGRCASYSPTGTGIS
ncbi:MAG TPA: glycosyltransferase family 39 protein [Solirubrobacteraceae bacterium]|nr:glycosyltransferase family 39 protein [Solirubrobacteraceae bacterium]